MKILTTMISSNMQQTEPYPYSPNFVNYINQTRFKLPYIYMFIKVSEKALANYTCAYHCIQYTGTVG